MHACHTWDEGGRETETLKEIYHDLEVKRSLNVIDLINTVITFSLKSVTQKPIHYCPCPWTNSLQFLFGSYPLLKNVCLYCLSPLANSFRQKNKNQFSPSLWYLPDSIPIRGPLACPDRLPAFPFPTSLHMDVSCTCDRALPGSCPIQPWDLGLTIREVHTTREILFQALQTSHSKYQTVTVKEKNWNR